MIAIGNYCMSAEITHVPKKNSEGTRKKGWMMKPERHIWDEGSTHRAVAGKEYDEVWDYAERLEAELEKIICHWCEAEVTEDEANEHYKSCTKNPLKAENEALMKYVPKHVRKEWEYYRTLHTGESDGQTNVTV